MHPLRQVTRWMVGAAALSCALGLSGAASADNPPAYGLLPAEATEWTVLVFAARVPTAARAQPVAFSVEAKWTADGQEASRKLTGQVAWLKTVELGLSLPAGCSSLTVALDWQAPGTDLDLGLWCASRGLHLAPLFTVLKPERVRLDAQTQAFYQWLTQEHPDWWKGYPFWAEIEAAPQADAKGQG